jgi:hypothetical protein
MANLSFDPKEIAPLLQKMGLGQAPDTTPPAPATPQMTQTPDLGQAPSSARPAVDAMPPPPLPPTPAQAGFNEWSADPKNQKMVADGITQPGQPLVPPAAAAQFGGVAPLGGSPQAAPSPFGASSAPATPPAPTASPMDTAQAKLNTDQKALTTLQTSGPGVSQIKNPWLRTIARIGDAAGTVLAPGVMSVVPGTTVHNWTLQNLKQGQVAGDQNSMQNIAQLANTQAEARIHTAEAKQAENPTPAAPEYDYVDGPNGKVAIRKGTTTATPVTLPGGAPLGAKVEGPKTPLELALRDNPKLTAAEWDAQQQHPISQQEADTLNATWNPILAKHGLPIGQIKAGQPRAEATAATAAFNGAIGKQQGDTHITIAQQGQQQRAAASLARTGPIDMSSPESQSALDEAAKGNVALSDLLPRGATFGQRAAVVAALKSRNPDYNSGDHAIENSVRRYMTSGAGGTTLAAGNTLTHHLDLYDKAVDDVQNGDVKILNKLGNEMQIQMGNDAQTNLALVRQGVAMEAARFYTGGIPGEKEIDQFNNNLSGDGSPGQMHGGANTVRAMAKGKMQGLQAQAQAGASGHANFPGTTPAPAAGGQFSVTAPDGSVHPFATQAQADTFKKLAGIK